jgi:DNA-damage-inducible protein D
MPELAFFFASEGALFEQRGFSNGGRYWYARDFMQMLGYETYSGFRNAINRAVGTCTTLGIPVDENFLRVERDIEGQKVADHKLSRFACYLVAMNGDVRKPHVAAAQAYFAGLAEAARQYIESAQEVERLGIRDEVTDRERSLSGVAKQAGVEVYAFFQNAGYRGMYNMDLGRLKEFKGLPDPGRSLLDFMGKRELVGNLFRITETEATIKSQGTSGQRDAEVVAHRVGERVRKEMMASDGTRPEDLPLERDIRDVRKELKKTARTLKTWTGRHRAGRSCHLPSRHGELAVPCPAALKAT